MQHVESRADLAHATPGPQDHGHPQGTGWVSTGGLAIVHRYGACCLSKSLLVGVIAIGLVACGTSPPVRFYTIEAMAPAVDRTAASGPAPYRGPVLYVGAFRVPPAMDRQELLRDVESARVQVLELDQWAAPLARSARLALAQDLAARLPIGKLQFIGASRGSPIAVLKIDVLSFKVVGGVASMVATWVVEPPTSAPSAADGHHGEPAFPAAHVTAINGDARLQAPAGNGALETAKAWSALLALLADDIVAKTAASSP